VESEGGPPGGSGGGYNRGGGKHLGEKIKRGSLAWLYRNTRRGGVRTAPLQTEDGGGLVGGTPPPGAFAE